MNASHAPVRIIGIHFYLKCAPLDSAAHAQKWISIVEHTAKHATHAMITIMFHYAATVSCIATAARHSCRAFSFGCAERSVHTRHQDHIGRMRMLVLYAVRSTEIAYLPINYACIFFAEHIIWLLESCAAYRFVFASTKVYTRMLPVCASQGIREL